MTSTWHWKAFYSIGSVGRTHTTDESYGGRQSEDAPNERRKGSPQKGAFSAVHPRLEGDSVKDIQSERAERQHCDVGQMEDFEGG